jgi:hypothetical protein
MSENQAEPMETSKPFHFEGETKDSDYLGVCRTDFKTEILNFAYLNDLGVYVNNDGLDSEFLETSKPLAYQTTNRSVLLAKKIMTLLPNLKIQLTIECIQKRATGALQIDLRNMTNFSTGNDLNVEVGLLYQRQIQKYGNMKTDIKLFTATLGKITVLLYPFNLHNDIISSEESAMTFKSSIEIALKLPNDLNTSITTMPFSEVEFNDAEIICENQTFKCHKSMLALKSDVFKAMLMTTEFSEKITGTVHVDDINAKTMNTLLKFMYQNKITSEEAMDLNLIVAANKYNIVDLVSKCEKIIPMTMTSTNIMDVLAVAKLLPTPNLLERAKRFLSHEVGRPKINLGPRWLQLRTENPALGNEILESCLNQSFSDPAISSDSDSD